jgi:hypothetical protein
MNEVRSVRPVLTKEEARHIFEYVKYRACEMMVEGGRFVDGLKAAGVEFFAGVPVKFPCGCHCTDKGNCSNNCINELYQKGLPL